MDRRTFLHSLATVPWAPYFDALAFPPRDPDACIHSSVPLCTLVRATTTQGNSIGLAGFGTAASAIALTLKEHLGLLENSVAIATPDFFWSHPETQKPHEDTLLSSILTDAIRSFAEGLDTICWVIDASFRCPLAWPTAIAAGLTDTAAAPIVVSIELPQHHLANESDNSPRLIDTLPQTMKAPVCSLPAKTPLAVAASVVEHVCLATMGPYATPSIVGVDPEDIRWVLGTGNPLSVGFAQSVGPESALRAVQAAIAHPLLGESRLSGAEGVLAYIEAPSAMLKMRDIRTVLDQIRTSTNDPFVIFGASPNPALANRYRVTLLARE